MRVDGIRTAVLIPCLDEESTIGDVVAGFQVALPNAAIHVYDNGSTDRTAEIAAVAGAHVATEPLRGKGRVLRRMLADVEADVYVLVDGDGTYDPAESPAMIKRLVDDGLDMVVGSRTPPPARLGHQAGNRMFNVLYRWLFGSMFTDILSGYRALSRRFVRSLPSAAKGFETETEMSVHASQLCLPAAEIPVSYRSRPPGSASKLRTVRDGWKILKAMASLLVDNRPMFLFGWLGTALAFGALFLGLPVVVDFAQTGLVERLPTAVVATGMTLASALSLVLGAVLDAIAKSRIEAKRLAYLNT